MRKLVAAGIVLLVVLGAISTTFGLLVFRPLPTIDADERLLGLHERVEVLRDSYGVPHVFADDLHDVFFAQGYVTAQDRLWQMDIYRRAAEGRLAEVLGEPGLESDRFMRTLGLGRAAQLDWLRPSGVRWLRGRGGGTRAAGDREGRRDRRGAAAGQPRLARR